MFWMADCICDATVPTLALAALIVPRADARIAALPHVTALVSSYLDVSLVLTPLQAAGRSSPRLLDRVLTRLMDDPAVDPAFRSHWLAQAMDIAIKKNDLVMVTRIHHWHPAPLTVRSLQVALHYGSLELVLWIVENRRDRRCGDAGLAHLCRACLNRILGEPTPLEGPNPGHVIEWLLSVGVADERIYRVTPSLDLLSWLETRGRLGKLTNLLRRVVESSIAGEHIHGLTSTLDLLIWLNTRGHLDKLNLASVLMEMLKCERVENVDAIQYLLDYGVSVEEERLIDSLIQASCQRQCNDTKMESILSSRLCNSFRDYVTWASMRPGGAKVLQWDATFMAEKIVYRTTSMPRRIGWYAGIACHVETLMWLREERSGDLPYVPVRRPAEESDLLALYEWMVKSGVDGWSDDDRFCAARMGFLSVIQWLTAHKPDRLTAHTMEAAARAGHLNIVRWLHENRDDGCTPETLAFAAKNGHLHIVQWLLARRTEGDVNKAMVSATVSGQLEVLAWLHANSVGGCGACVLRSAASDLDCDGGSLNALRWLTNHATRSGSCLGHCIEPRYNPATFGSVPVSALAGGDVDLARYLLEEHRSSFTLDSIAMVFENGHLPAIQWLYANVPDMVDWQQALETARSAGNHPHVHDWLATVLGDA